MIFTNNVYIKNEKQIKMNIYIKIHRAKKNIFVRSLEKYVTLDRILFFFIYYYLTHGEFFTPA